jgi:hypothetical protein
VGALEEEEEVKEWEREEEEPVEAPFAGVEDEEELEVVEILLYELFDEVRFEEVLFIGVLEEEEEEEGVEEEEEEEGLVEGLLGVFSLLGLLFALFEAE